MSHAPYEAHFDKLGDIPISRGVHDKNQGTLYVVVMQKRKQRFDTELSSERKFCCAKKAAFFRKMKVDSK